VRLLNLDIETAPALVYIWDLQTRYVSPEKIVKPKEMLCFAGKWVGDDDVYFFSKWDDGPEAMVQQVWELVNQADAVLHYNGRRFDIPWLNTEFAKAELTPPSPYGQIDLYRAVKKNFAFMSNSLKFVSKSLGTTHKLENEGMSLWIKVMEGDPQAQRKMEEYNCGDLFANEDLYHRILPWIPSHPSYAVIDGNSTGMTCPQCGSPDVEANGRAYTAVSVYDRYLCTNCGKWLRGAHRLSGSDLRAVQ
jgi:predicted RNA-binding Zn-ribbon protein involved in translation (DUF1610 family)